MLTVYIPIIYTKLSSVGAPLKRVLIQNQGVNPVYLTQKSTTPTKGDPVFILFKGESIEINNLGDDIWAYGADPSGTRVLINEIGGVFGSVPIPSDIFTSSSEGFRRFRVDPGQTSFFAGREFRTFKELNIAGNGSYTIRASVPGNIILTEVSLDLDNGFARLGTYTGGTQSGTFAETLPILNKNNMTIGPDKQAIVTPTVVLTAGGTHTGGTELDVVRLKTASNNTQVSTVGDTEGDERGISPGTYYFRLTSLSAEAVTGTLHLAWEQR